MVNLDFDTMPAVGINVMVVGQTTQTVKNIDGESVLEFLVDENLGEREPKDFQLEMRHSPKISYLANKTNSINQNLRSTTAILTGLLCYQEPITDDNTAEETVPEKHVLKLDDITLVASNRSNTSTQSVDLPWLKQEPTSPGKHTPRGSTPRSKRGRTLSQVSPTRQTRSQSLATVLQQNPIPNNMNDTPNEPTNDKSTS